MSPVIGFAVGRCSGDPAWGFVAGILVVVVGLVSIWIGATVRAPYRQRTEARQLIKSLRESKPPKNADALIAAFTAIGPHAENFIEKRRAYQQADQWPPIMTHQYLADRRQEFQSAESTYQQARIEAEKQANIADDTLGHRMKAIMLGIHSQVEGKLPSAQDSLVQPPSIDALVQQAISYIRSGGHS